MVISELNNRLLRTFYGLCRPSERISIICAYNDPGKLDRFLVSSLKNQACPFELLTIDNTRGQHHSAGKILNKAAGKARFPYLMFVHQDVAILSRYWLRGAIRMLHGLERCGAVGVAGKTTSGNVTDVLHGSPPVPAGKPLSGKPAESQTLDGCLMIVPRTLFEQVLFDEAHEGWYLYVAGYCLDLVRRGYKNYVIPSGIYHESEGPANPAVFEKAREYLLNKHRGFIDIIYTTIGIWTIGPRDKLRRNKE